MQFYSKKLQQSCVSTFGFPVQTETHQDFCYYPRFPILFLSFLGIFFFSEPDKVFGTVQRHQSFLRNRAVGRGAKVSGSSKHSDVI